MPILLLNNPLSDLSSLGLANYEITLIEGMHDIANHIDNLLVELPNHLRPEDRSKVTHLLEILNQGNVVKRFCDKRKMLQVMKGYEIDGNVSKLLGTLCEIQRILYLGEDFRTPKEILRLYNVCFQHFVTMIKFDKLKMTREKIYGKYLHNLLVHAPLQYRLVSGDSINYSINCEDEERFFKTICDITMVLQITVRVI